MSEKLISRRGAFSLLGLAAALALPTTVLTTSDAEAQAQPTAPAPTAPPPTAPTPGTPATSGMTRREQRRAARRTGREERREARRTSRQQRREARRTARTQRREARHTARTQRREARRGMYMQSTKPIKQQQ
jgi:hypothetical protein